ncbi:universal bacterial protein YeaZ [Megasphaera cerevisiae DSM 20462]|jgi:tRNA threonylcarbamoyladenosine biosynthesis protein TsaB|uniref:Universal bacterial protein YeaZ n=1 Tax=Megasphaera cerevisiae DSM 20462 TaxID=1122219 RepID=A0A0J6ZKD3_9FIRM|nr:tRNA (adenosine(37)-N6)-threonylcarbamoyltransferase complex dimerization subunit type 1 TsaB [Megasphaera cerevisiae]KMO85291.1 universal bacterial protein YeaZ [Megasphaera cerevisiae DSM 20462]MCI1750404.1 tRNA (adenosine(37)-N6)-threonylcarbamoyltransferase complex dimerization subunit type 1 TsaB [Megasphaera cerevisiae]OKY52437.1 tRNA (adenosine(37)-N6)-threonylcarbamoyltransferase complex dimerization subunit type 1 TsaB [Megasphaera cerevisiae]SKA24429.1 tRNA threonylcarbamoyladenosi
MLLAVETSSLVSSVALLHDNILRAELTIQAKLTHSEQLMPHIADMLEKASVQKQDIDSIAVSVGPGSFTGLRIGLATAKGLSFAWKVPIIGIETPVSMAWNFVGAAARICVLVDAQKGNVYASVYEWSQGELHVIMPVCIMPLTKILDILEQQGKRIVFCGDGITVGHQKIQEGCPLFSIAPPTMVIPRAGSLAMAALVRLKNNDIDDCMTLTPSYKRRSEAEVLWEKKHGEQLCL